MSGKGSAFLKGGAICLGAFIAIGIVVVAIGGRVHIDCGGACCLFTFGGLAGLLVLWIYNKGKDEN